MCNVMEEYTEERVRENRMKTIQTMLANGIDKQVIVISGFSEEEIKMAEENLLAKVYNFDYLILCLYLQLII